MRSHRALLGAALLTTTVLSTVGPAYAATAGHDIPAARPRAVAVQSAFGDGSFETPTAPAGSFTTVSAGNAIGPWTVSAGTVDLIGAGFWEAAHGDQSVDLSGNWEGTVTQNFATQPGTRYRVSYALAGNPTDEPTVKTGQVRVNGFNAQDFSFDTTGKTYSDMGYTTQSFEFVASYPQTTLSFASTTPSASGPVLDAVTVTPIC